MDGQAVGRNSGHSSLSGGDVSGTEQIVGTDARPDPELISGGSGARSPLEGRAGTGKLTTRHRSVEHGGPSGGVGVVGVLPDGVDFVPQPRVDYAVVGRQAGDGSLRG